MCCYTALWNKDVRQPAFAKKTRHITKQHTITIYTRKNALNFFCPFCSGTTFGFGAVFDTFGFLAGALLPDAVPSLLPITAFVFMLPEDVESGSRTAAFPVDSSGTFSWSPMDSRMLCGGGWTTVLLQYTQANEMKKRKKISHNDYKRVPYSS